MPDFIKLFDNVNRNWKIAAVAIALLGLGAAAAKTTATIIAIPDELNEHDDRLRTLSLNGMEWTRSILTQNQEILVELQHIRKNQDVLLCVKIAELRHTDWGRCIFGTMP